MEFKEELDACLQEVNAKLQDHTELTPEDFATLLVIALLEEGEL